MKKNIPNAERLGARIRRDWIRNRSLYIMVIPVLLFTFYFTISPCMAQLWRLWIIARDLALLAVNGLILITLSGSFAVRIAGR